MEILTKNIASIIGFLGIIITYGFNSRKDRKMQLFKTKQKYYNVFLESFIIKLSELKALENIQTNILKLELQLKQLKVNMLNLKKELSVKESKLLPLEIKDTIEKLEKAKDIIEKQISLEKIEELKIDVKVLEANKFFSIEASRLPLYASEEMIDFIEKCKDPNFKLKIEEFYQLMRTDLNSGKVKKIKKINLSATLYM